VRAVFYVQLHGGELAGWRARRAVYPPVADPPLPDLGGCWLGRDPDGPQIRAPVPPLVRQRPPFVAWVTGLTPLCGHLTACAERRQEGVEVPHTCPARAYAVMARAELMEVSALACPIADSRESRVANSRRAFRGAAGVVPVQRLRSKRARASYVGRPCAGGAGGGGVNRRRRVNYAPPGR
jgi:hypothetical protein